MLLRKPHSAKKLKIIAELEGLNSAFASLFQVTSNSSQSQSGG